MRNLREDGYEDGDDQIGSFDSSGPGFFQTHTSPLSPAQAGFCYLGARSPQVPFHFTWGYKYVAATQLKKKILARP